MLLQHYDRLYWKHWIATMVDPGNRRQDEHEGRDDESTAERVEDWLRGLRAQRSTSGGEAPARGRQNQTASGDDPAEAFLKAARRLAASPRAQEALARRLAGQEGAADDPSLRALARVLQSLGEDLAKVFESMGGPSGGASVLDRPEVHDEPRLSDIDGGGGDDFLDDEGDGGGDGDEEPWPSAFIGYRVGLVDSVDVGTCRDGCCTAIFVDHPGLRAAIWFPTEACSALAANLSEFLVNSRGETAELGVPPFGVGDPPARGQVQATVQFFTDDVHLDHAVSESDRKQGGFARFLAYDQGLGHGGPPLIDVLFTVAQARALRKGLRRAARNMPKE
jgi:hypothetical protein